MGRDGREGEDRKGEERGQAGERRVGERKERGGEGMSPTFGVKFTPPAICLHRQIAYGTWAFLLKFWNKSNEFSVIVHIK